MIGTGQAIDHQEAGRVSSVIRQALVDVWPLEVVKQQTTIIYGGSVDQVNIGDFVGRDYLSGCLVGGASLEADKFLLLLKAIS